jgi:reactive chlorine resistance protein C
MTNDVQVRVLGGAADSAANKVAAVGQWVALAGVVLPLALIGMLKFTQYEIDALKPLISNTPWLAWLYPTLGEAGTSYLLGVVELVTAALFVAARWSARAGVAGGALGALTFATTTSTMLALPIWHDPIGGFPWLNDLGSFLIKDVALLGISLLVLGESLGRVRQQAR